MRGKLIAIEGTDGSGKGTQVAKLYQRLIDAGYDVVTFSFPRYDEPSSFFLREYLTGGFGEAGKINPYRASLFYSLDRFAASQELNLALERGQLVLCDRYIGSNMAHQGSKLKTVSEQLAYLAWLDHLEYEILGIPRVDLNLILSIPATISMKLIEQKAARKYLQGGKTDQHEQDLSHLRQTERVYRYLGRLFPNWKEIRCVDKGELLSIEQVSELIWKHVQPVIRGLPKNAPARLPI